MRRSAVFVSTHNALEETGGGVQVCTRDFREVLNRNFELAIVGFDTDRRFGSRLRNRIDRRSYRRRIPPELAERVRAAVNERKAENVFFNLLDFPAVAAHLRGTADRRLKLIHLSHGLDSTDIAIGQQFQRRMAVDLRFDPRAAAELGGKLQFEADYRRYLDAAICISPLDAELERWLGVPSTCWIPRNIREQPLEARPVDGRVGCVATLDHPPNYSGFLELLGAVEAEAPRDFKLRVVGGPEKTGRELAGLFACVEYCGRLSDEELRAEAATWCCFVHPVFAYARGCSTKVAAALGWGLPLASTPAGVRGYVWDEAVLPLCADPHQLAQETLRKSRVADFQSSVDRSRRIAEMQPTVEQSARQVAKFVASV